MWPIWPHRKKDGRLDLMHEHQTKPQFAEHACKPAKPATLYRVRLSLSEFSYRETGLQIWKKYGAAHAAANSARVSTPG